MNRVATWCRLRHAPVHDGGVRDFKRHPPLPPVPLSFHIRAMAKAPKSRPKASKPDVHPLGEHLAALLNPALVEKPPGFAEAPAAFELASIRAA